MLAAETGSESKWQCNEMIGPHLPQVGHDMYAQRVPEGNRIPQYVGHKKRPRSTWLRLQAVKRGKGEG
jgi:hypothetical protein